MRADLDDIFITLIAGTKELRLQQTKNVMAWREGDTRDHDLAQGDIQVNHPFILLHQE